MGGIAWLGSIKWIVQLVTWASTIFVARLLAPDDYGLLAMGAVLLAFITAISDSGIGLTVVTVRAMTVSQVAQLNSAAILLGFLCFGTACVAAVPIGGFYDEPALVPVIVAMGFTFVISAFRIVPMALLQRERYFRRVAIIEGAQGLLQAFATLILASLGFRYWSLVLAGLFGALVSSAATVALRPVQLARPRWSELQPIASFTRHVFVSRVLWYSYQNADFVVAGKRLGSEALGAYSYAWTLASIPVDKLSALLSSVTPSIFAAVQTDIPALRRYFLIITEGTASIAFPFTLGIALVARDLVPVVFGERWLAMIVPLQLLASYAAVRTIHPTAANALVVTGDTRFQMYQTAVAAIVLPPTFWVGSRWGTTGIALGWIVAHPLILYLPTHKRLFKRLDLTTGEYFRALWPALSACAMMAAAVWVAGAFTPTHLPQGARLALEIVAGAVAYTGVFSVFYRERVSAFRTLWRTGKAAQEHSISGQRPSG